MLVNNDINKNSSIALTSVELQVFDVCLRVSFPKVRLISYAEIRDSFQLGGIPEICKVMRPITRQSYCSS